MAEKKEIKASLEVDFSKVEQKIREVDQRAREEDQKAEAVERRTSRLVERMKEAQASARELESRVGGRIEDLVKDFGKFSVKSLLFDTFTNYSGINTADAGPLARIATAGLVAGATTLNPIYGLLAAMGKSIDYLRDSQREYQRQVEELRQDQAERERETAEMLREIRSAFDLREFENLKEIEAIRTGVDKEENELIRNTWLLTAGEN